MGVLRFLFLPEFGRALAEAGRASGRIGRGFLALPERGGGRRWRRLIEPTRRVRVLLGLTVSLLGAALATLGVAGLAAEAAAQSINPGLFDRPDRATRDLLAFLSDLDATGHSVLGDMLFAFNGGVLVLAGFLLIWHAAAGAVDTARRGRWGFGVWEIVRVVTAVALMAPLPGGMNGAQHAVVGLANLGGEFAAAVWTPFSQRALGRGDPIVPRPSEAVWRSAIARVLLSETCRHAANGAARAAGDTPYVVLRRERTGGVEILRYDGDRRGMPRNLCGAVRFKGLDRDDSRGIAAHGHRKALTSLLPQLRELAVELGDRYVPGSPAYGKSLPDVEAALDARGLAEAYAAVLDAALRRAASEERRALEAAVAEDARESSWLSAASFFNTVAARTGLFQAAARDVPGAALPLPGLDRWSPAAGAAVKNLLAALADSRAWQPVSFTAGVGAAGPLSVASGGDQGPAGGLFAFIDLDATVIAGSGNPIVDLAGFGHSLVAAALSAIATLSGVAAGSGLLESIPFFGKGLDAFESVWRVTDGFVSTILGVLLIAGATLAYVLPALPFIRFLFGIFGWLVNVVEAVLAVTVFAAAHVTRGDGDGLTVPATRQGWLFLPGLVLRPPLMLFGLILGYFVFLAAIGLLNEVWLPQLRDANAADGLGPVGFLAMLALYVMAAYALMNGAFKLIDLLPATVLEWIGGRGNASGGEAERVGSAAIGGIARAGSVRLTNRLRAGELR